MSATDLPIPLTARVAPTDADRSSAPRNLVFAAAIGLAIGALTSFGQTVLDAPWSACANSASAWLIAPFVVGALASSRRTAIRVGLLACAMQLVGYYVTAELRGFATGGAVLVFWGACSLIGGPILGAAGHLWRRAPSRLGGLGAAVLASAFIAEGLWTYWHVLDYQATAALWFAIGGALAVALARRAADLRWLALTIPAGVLGQVALSVIYRQSFT